MPWNRLVKGYHAFRKDAYQGHKALYSQLGAGQSPKVMLIGCSDSRVDPAEIFAAPPGELFVARNVANYVPHHNHGDIFCSTSAAIEYAVTVLKVDIVVVLGHESCGGVAGCLKGLGDNPDSYVGAWVAFLNDARDKIIADGVPEDQRQKALEFEGVRQSLENLMTFPFVQDAVEAGTLVLRGAYFSIAEAQLHLADETGQFNPVEPIKTLS